MRTYPPIKNESPGTSVPGRISFVKSKSPTGWTASLYLSGTIAEENWTAESFQRELDWYETGNDVDDISLIINSRGGDLYQASAMYDALKKCKKKVVAKIYGVCGSAATLIACAAQEVFMAPNSTWFIHNPSGSVDGNAADMEAYLENMKRFENMLVGIYMERTGMSEEDIRKAMKESATYNAEEAIAAGWANGIIEAEEPTVSPVTAVTPPALAACLRGDPGYPQNPVEPVTETGGTAPLPATTDTVTVEKSSLKNFCDGLLCLFGLGTNEPQDPPAPPVPAPDTQTTEGETNDEESWHARYDFLKNEMSLLKAELKGNNALISARTAALTASEKAFEDRVQAAATAQIASLGHQSGDLPRAGGETTQPETDPANMTDKEKFKAYAEAAPGDKSRLFRELFGNEFRNLKK